MHPLLAATAVPPFLELAQPGELTAYAPDEASSAVGDVLGRCTSLRRLTCSHGLLPPTFPPSLEDLCMVFADAEAGSFAVALSRQARLSHSLAGLRSLAKLTLCFFSTAGCGNFSCQGVVVCAAPELARLTSLKVLELDVTCSPSMPAFDLGGLCAVAAAGIKLKFIARTRAQCVALTRAEIWAGLGKAPLLLQLQLVFDHDPDFEGPRPGEASFEKVFMPSVRCQELLLQLRYDCSLCASLLPAMSYDLARVSFRSYADVTLPWAALSTRPGVYVVSEFCSFTVVGCPGRPPEVRHGWALVLRQEDRERVKGLQLSAFRLGFRGQHLVWGDSPLLHEGALAAEIGSLE